MASTNQAILVGRIGKDPELKYSQSGTAYCSFSVATSEHHKGQKEEVEWHQVTTFGTRAEHCAKYLRKGSLVSVTGRIKPRSWTKDGITHHRTEIKAWDVQFLSGAGGGEKPAERQQMQADPQYEPAYEQPASGYDECPF